MTTDLVNLINQTKKDVESLRAFRRSSKQGMKSTSKKSNYVSPLGDRSKDDAYGLTDANKRLLSNKSDKLKTKKKRIVNGSNSSRKNKVKTKQDTYQPMTGTIDLISRNER